MRIFLTLVLGICFVVSFAQQGKEEKVGLQSNPVLQQVQQSPTQSSRTAKTTTHYSKAPFNEFTFPFTDWFDQGTTELNDTLWQGHHVKIQGGVAVMNAQDSGNTTYSSGDGSVGEADVLQSNNINIQSSNGQLFISFAYSTGSSWKPTDVLSLLFKTQSGVFAPVWSDDHAFSANRIISMPIDLSLFASDTFAFKFVCTTDRSINNTSTFLVHHVNMTDRLSIPWYENFAVSDSKNEGLASPVNWLRAQPEIRNDGTIYGLRNVVFNAYDRHGNLYTHNGYGDTLISQPIDLTSPRVQDSVFLRFLYRKYPAANITDSLLLDFLDTGNQWVSIWKTDASQVTSAYGTFLRQINNPAFRHANFQIRLINRCDYTPTDTLLFGVTGFHIGTKIRLPFIDDFSADKLYPSTERWKEKQVYINNDFAIAPPSVNVATFDGLDERGNAYGQGNGYLDSLTSLSLNLSGFTRTDSVYLSFYVQPQGLGDLPNPSDSLVLEFRSNQFDPLAWHTVWSGTAPEYSTTAFAKIAVFLDSVYLTDDFQFRFKNIGSRTGNLDNWHLDYIILNQGRSRDDGYFDFSLSSNPPSLLKKYSSMPRKHFERNPAGYINSLLQMLISNNDKSTVPLNFALSIYDPENNRIDTFPNTHPGVSGETRSNVAITSLLGSLNSSITSDSVVFHSRYYVNFNNNFDNIPTNDTLNIPTIFSNYFAYDDGTAEAGYGIENQPGSVALGYKLETADSLYGMSMFFNQSASDVSTQAFNLMVWSKIGTNGNGTGETVIKRILQSRPTYKNVRNGFYYLEFDKPIYLPAGTFYIGWEQSGIFNLNMGLDVNYQVQGSPAKNAEMWFKVYDVWAKTQIEGALMMRPIVGKWIDPPVGVKEVEMPRTDFEVSVYPNPAAGRVYVRTNTEHNLSISLIDIAGKTIMTSMDNQKSLPLTEVANGVYLIRVLDLETGNTSVKKLFINQ